jgi:hypothetical protein
MVGMTHEARKREHGDEELRFVPRVEIFDVGD